MSESDLVEAILEDCRRRFIEGDRRQLLMAVIWCGRYNTPPPRWLTEEFESITRGYVQGEFKSMDEVFNTARPPGWRQNTVYKKTHIDHTGLTLPEKIYRAVQAESRNGRAIDRQLFRDVAKQFPGLSAGTVDAYYYEAKSATDCDS